MQPGDLPSWYQSLWPIP